MIDYYDGYFNFSTLFQVYGSASYKAISFASISCGIYVLMYFYGGGDIEDGLKQYDLLDHPYPMAVIFTAFMFVLSAKVTFCYNRFWEACTALHNMHAKWLDVGSTMAAFHMQSKEFDNLRPTSFGDNHHHLHRIVQPPDAMQNSKSIFRDSPLEGDLVLPRGGNNNKEYAKLPTKLTETQTFISEDGDSTYSEGKMAPKFGRYPNTKHGKKQAKNQSSTNHLGLPFPEYKSHRTRSLNVATGTANSTIPTNRCSTSPSIGIYENKNNSSLTMFLKEGAHLVSLLSAVALSSLRCDEEASIVEFVPGHHWPNYNSENDGDMQKYGYESNGLQTLMKYMFDVSRTKDERATYNAARPFPVIGGISEREAILLQSARGASAKTALVFLWLQEFIIREQLAGSMGNVAPPIVSRIPQYLSDGHMWYNAARKMSYVPFPFPHTQMATIFVLASVVLVPTLMLSKTHVWFGLVLNFLTVLLFAGLNELSKELEYPFRSMPNDLPLNLFQAHFNESIVTMFAGFHPDARREIEEVESLNVI